MSAFLETINFNNQAIYILSQGCKLNFSKPTWVHKTGRFVCTLYARGGPHCADIRTSNSSGKLNLNLQFGYPINNRNLTFTFGVYFHCKYQHRGFIFSLSKL